MNLPEATIETHRNGGKLSSISAIMPVWMKKEEDGHTKVIIPLLGLTTWAASENDVEAAASEAIQSFCMAAEKHGLGVDEELKALGWDAEETSPKHGLLSHTTSDELLQQVMQTADQFAFSQLAIC